MFIQIYSTSQSTRNTVSSIIFIVIIILIALLIYYLLTSVSKDITLEDIVIGKYMNVNPGDLSKQDFILPLNYREIVSILTMLRLQGEIGRITIYNNTDYERETSLKFKETRRRGVKLNVQNTLKETNTQVQQQVNIGYTQAFIDNVHIPLSIMITKYVRAYDFILKTLIKHCGVENAYPLARTALSRVIRDVSILGSNIFGNENEEGWLNEDKLFVYLGPPIVKVTKNKTKI